MFITFDNDTFYFTPLCYHPTTTLFVDDDSGFLNDLAALFKQKIPLLTFDSPNKAIQHIDQNQYFLFRHRCLKEDGFNYAAIRREMYNPDRFKEIVTSVIDYDMPEKNGFDLMSSLHLPMLGEHHSYILLSGTSPDDFDKKFSTSATATNYISKFDPAYKTKLLTQIQERSIAIKQWASCDFALNLARNPNEKTSFLLDGNFLPILNKYIEENNICEVYLFDKQGSLLFLDDEANPSWLFVRNHFGIENSIQQAKDYGAPKPVIDALKSKEVILSLYEEEDFKIRQTIDWNDYLLPVHLFAGNDKYMRFFNLDHHPQYYYAFTTKFPDNRLYLDKILSYKEFLKLNQK